MTLVSFVYDNNFLRNIVRLVLKKKEEKKDKGGNSTTIF